MINFPFATRHNICAILRQMSCHLTKMNSNYYCVFINFEAKSICKTWLPTSCFENVWKLRGVLNVRVTAGHRLPRHRRSQLEGGAIPVFVWNRRIFLQNRVKFLEFQDACWRFCDKMCKKVLVLSIYKKQQKSLQSDKKSKISD